MRKVDMWYTARSIPVRLGLAALMVFFLATCASDEAAAPSDDPAGPDNPPTDPGSLSRVVIRPLSLWLNPGQTRDFIAYGITSGDDSVGVTVTWGATGGSINGQGRYTAPDQLGSYQVTASDNENGVTATASITVAEPGSFAPPWFEENFATYGTDPATATQNWRDDIHGWWEGPTHQETLEEEFSIVQENIPGVGNVMSWQVLQRPGDECKPGHGPGRMLLLPEPYPTEMWLEMYVKFSANYRTNYCEGNPDGSGNEAGDHKFIYFDRKDATVRDANRKWQLKTGTFGSMLSVRSPGVDWARVHTASDDLPSPCFNDQWQRWRFHMRRASAPGVSDGHMEWRRVDLLEPDRVMPALCHEGRVYQLLQAPGAEGCLEARGCMDVGTQDYHEGFYRFKLGKTMNGGPWGESQQWWWGPIRVWSSDPGWEW